MCVVTLLSYARAQLPMRTSHTCSDEMRFTSICVLMATRIQSKLAICKPMRYVNPLCVSPVFPIPMEDHDAPPTVDGYAAKRPPTRRGTKLRWRASDARSTPRADMLVQHRRQMAEETSLLHPQPPSPHLNPHTHAPTPPLPLQCTLGGETPMGGSRLGTHTDSMGHKREDERH
jgi:hypothetical protein